jgi:hypothetical protein
MAGVPAPLPVSAGGRAKRSVFDALIGSIIHSLILRMIIIILPARTSDKENGDHAPNAPHTI